MNKNPNQIISCNEMLSNFFSNIEKSQYKEKDDVTGAWKKIITSIKKNDGSNEELGDKLYSHSSLVEIKNEILLIETDHPGFIQLFRIYEKYILNGLKKYVPQLTIKSLSFRLKGSSFTLKNKIQHEEESEKKYMQKKFKEEEEAIEKVYKKNSAKHSDNISPEIKDAFARMKKSMLTKDKK